MMKASNSNVPASVPSVAVARLVGHDGPIQAVVLTADGKYCLTAGQDRTVRLWNPARVDPAFADSSSLMMPRALPIQTYSQGHTHGVAAIATDDESTTTLLSASDKTLVVTDLLTQQVKRRFFGHHGRINAVTFAGETYLSASYDGTVRIWDGRSHNTNTPIQILSDAKDSVSAVQYDDNMIRTASVDGIVRTYDVRQGRLYCDDFQNAITSFASTHDKQCLAVSCLDGTIRLMEQASGELLNTFENHHKAGNYALECSLTADDGCVVTGSEDGRVVLYDLVRGTLVQSLVGHSRPTCSIATHPKRADVLVSASYDGHAVVWANDPSYIQRLE